MRLRRTALAGVAALFCTIGWADVAAANHILAPHAEGGCWGTPAEATIVKFFGDTPDLNTFMTRIVPRESGCDPCASYPSTHVCGIQTPNAKGLAQLLGHDALIWAACPDVISGLLPWDWPACNLQAARWLYDGWRDRGGSGLEPWRGAY